MIFNVSMSKGTLGMLKLGRLTLTEAMSTTCLVSITRSITIANTTDIATREDGMALVILGKNITMAMVRAVSAIIMYRLGPCIQDSTPSCTTLNWATCDMKIIMANPLRKPYITGSEIRVKNISCLKMTISE